MVFSNPDRLIFTQHPIVRMAGNSFENTPILLQYDDLPLIEVIKEQAIGYTTSFKIYHPDGTDLATVKGSRMFRTENGKKAGLTLENPDLMTVCKLGNQTLFEITRVEAAALKTQAELYTNDGNFVRINDNSATALFKADAVQIGSSTIIVRGNHVVGAKIGIWVRSDGSVRLGQG
jgi:hypothetical protein